MADVQTAGVQMKDCVSKSISVFSILAHSWGDEMIELVANSAFFNPLTLDCSRYTSPQIEECVCAFFHVR